MPAHLCAACAENATQEEVARLWRERELSEEKQEPSLKTIPRFFVPKRTGAAMSQSQSELQQGVAKVVRARLQERMAGMLLETVDMDQLWRLLKQHASPPCAPTHRHSPFREMKRAELGRAGLGWTGTGRAKPVSPSSALAARDWINYDDFVQISESFSQVGLGWRRLFPGLDSLHPPLILPLPLLAPAPHPPTPAPCTRPSSSHSRPRCVDVPRRRSSARHTSSNSLTMIVGASRLVRCRPGSIPSRSEPIPPPGFTPGIAFFSPSRHTASPQVLHFFHWVRRKNALMRTRIELSSYDHRWAAVALPCVVLPCGSARVVLPCSSAPKSAGPKVTLPPKVAFAGTRLPCGCPQTTFPPPIASRSPPECATRIQPQEINR